MTALQWFGPEINNHILGRTPVEPDFFHIHQITDEEVSDVNMPCALAARVAMHNMDWPQPDPDSDSELWPMAATHSLAISPAAIS
jgi:hypothetical protein